MTLPILAALRPPSIGTSANGQVPLDILINVRVYEHYPVFLAPEMAGAFRRLALDCFRDTKIILGVSGGGGYRTLTEQENLFVQRYQFPAVAGLPPKQYRTWNGKKYSLRKGMASAAVPGTSNHGFGAAVDLEVIDPATGVGTAVASHPVVWPWLLANVVAHGLSWEFPEDPPQGEPWHLRLVSLPSVPVPVPPEPPPEEDEMAEPYIITSSKFAAWIIRWPSGALGWCSHAESGKYQQAPEETDDSTFESLMQACTVPPIPAAQQALLK